MKNRYIRNKGEAGYVTMIVVGGTAVVFSLCWFAQDLAHKALGW